MAHGTLARLIAIPSMFAPEMIMFLYSVGNRLFWPVYSQLLEEKICLYVLAYQPSVCANLSANKQASVAVRVAWAQWNAYQSFLLTPSFIVVTLVIAAWGDRFSRRWPLVMPPGGCLLQVALVLVAYYWRGYLAVWLMLSSGLVFTLGGCWLTMHTTVLCHGICSFFYYDDVWRKKQLS